MSTGTCGRSASDDLQTGLPMKSLCGKATLMAEFGICDVWYGSASPMDFASVTITN